MSRIIYVEDGDVNPGRKATKIVNFRLGVVPPNVRKIMLEINSGIYDEIKILVDDDVDCQQCATIAQMALIKHIKAVDVDVTISIIQVKLDK